MVTRLTAEMLVDLPVPKHAQISLDGKHVVVAVEPISKAEEHPLSTLWLASTDSTTGERKLTAGLANDTYPRWSPDNREIAFLSDRQERGKAQLFLLSMEGGEAQPQTDERGGVRALTWIPGEGRRIAYLAVNAMDEETKKRREEERDDANVYGEFWPFSSLVILDLDTDEHRAYDLDGQHVASMEPSPDGESLALTLWPTPEIDHVMGNSRLAILNLEDGSVDYLGEPQTEPRSITWSRDGSTLYYINGAGPTAVTSSQVWKHALNSADDPVCLTDDLDACIMDLARGGDQIAPVVLVATGAESAIGRLDGDSGEITTLRHVAGNLMYLSVSAGGTIAAVANTADMPGDVMVFGENDELKQVTQFHGWLDDVEPRNQEVVHWHRAGFDLDGVLIWPRGKSRADGPLPTVVSIHGGPYGRWTNSFIHGAFGRWLAEQGYLVFLPNPRGGMGHGREFAEAVLNTVGDEDYLDIMAGVDMLVEEGIADPDRMGCGGWSQGGFMTAWIVGQTDRFKAGVMGAGISDWGMMIATSDIPRYENLMGGGNPYESVGPHSFDRQSPISYVHNATTPTLIVHGENDERVPVSQAIFFHRGLRTYDVPTELVTYPREPHGIQERNHQLDLLQRVAGWYRKWIPLDE